MGHGEAFIASDRSFDPAFGKFVQIQDFESVGGGHGDRGAQSCALAANFCCLQGHHAGVADAGEVGHLTVPGGEVIGAELVQVGVATGAG